ncbi:MAG: hypothetical protein NC311_02035 [Muribaculaceae bacterium]|nr:hypothetical protein [Muribaculaceae bacterium]
MQRYLLIFMCVIELLGTANAAPQSTTCIIRSVFTSCNAGYYLSSQNCLACAAGTYKSTSGTATSCSSCSPWSGVYTTSAKTTQVSATSATASTAATSCYIASGTYYDATGTFKLTGNCAYKS